MKYNTIGGWRSNIASSTQKRNCCYTHGNIHSYACHEGTCAIHRPSWSTEVNLGKCPLSLQCYEFKVLLDDLVQVISKYGLSIHITSWKYLHVRYNGDALITFYSRTFRFAWSKIEVPRDVRNSKSENMTSSGENGLNIGTNASPKMGYLSYLG